MLTNFFISFSATCFVILGLWLVVVQMRYDDWKDDPNSVWRACGVGLYFRCPG